jgi:SSS family solute:Na+ symporter
LVTVVVSLVTKPKPDSELTGLVYGLTTIPREEQVSIFHRPVFWAVVVGIVFVVLNIIFW